MYKKFTLVILTLLLSACSFNFKGKDESAVIDKTISDEKKILSTEEKKELIEVNYQAKNNAKSVKDCSSIPDVKIKESCELELILNDAIQSKDPKLCDKIKDESFKVFCLGSVEN